MKTFKKITSVISYILCGVLALLLLCNLYVIAAKAITGKQPTVFGYSAAIVITGSMSGSIEVDDMVITRKESDYSVGDIIMFESGSSLVTHRIVEETDEGYRTQGDANNIQDTDPTAKDNVVGKVICQIPGAGKVIGYIKSPPGMICAVLLFFSASVMPSVFERKNIVKKGNEGV